MDKLTIQEVKEMQLQITCANEIEFTEVKDKLIAAGLTEWALQAGKDVIQVFADGDIMGDNQLGVYFGVVISAQEFLKRFVYPK